MMNEVDGMKQEENSNFFKIQLSTVSEKNVLFRIFKFENVSRSRI